MTVHRPAVPAHLRRSGIVLALTVAAVAPFQVALTTQATAPLGIHGTVDPPGIHKSVVTPGIHTNSEIHKDGPNKIHAPIVSPLRKI